MATKSAKFVETDPARIFMCHLRIIEMTTTRRDMVAVYKAAKKSVNSPLLIATIITAIRVRLMVLNLNNGYFYAEEI